jgi:molybdopterin converting factor subunit 1
MLEGSMKVTVKLFASFREATGEAQREVEAPSGTTVGQLWHDMVRDSPRLAPLSDSAAFAVNRQYARADVRLHDGDEVAFLPPVSGG